MQQAKTISTLPWGNVPPRIAHALQDLYYSFRPASPVAPPEVLFTAPYFDPTKSLCLFSHYDRHSCVDATVFTYLKELKSCGVNIAFVSTAPSLRSADKILLQDFCTHILHRKNYGLDFASWKSAMLAIPDYHKARQLILANDSTYIVGPLQRVFEEMSNNPCDFWGITESQELRPHLQSYFLCFKNRVLQHKAWQTFWQKLSAPHDKRQIIRQYETALTQQLEMAGFTPAAFVPRAALPKGPAGWCDNPTLAHGLRLVREHGVPLIKRSLLRDNPERIALSEWDANLAPTQAEAIKGHLAQAGGKLSANLPVPQTTILLPTCNGEKFLSALLNSCLRQPETTIIIRDDASDDETAALLRSYKNAHESRISLHNGEPRLGVIRNVEFLLSQVETDYFLLADQDDIWEDNKLVQLWYAMQQLEQIHGPDKPLLVYSDASLIDDKNRQISPSYFQSVQIPPQWSEDFCHALVMSNAPGCTMMGNRALAMAATPFPSNIFMHDWWLLLVAGGLGGVRVVNAQLIRYRQHGNNTMGAARWNCAAIAAKILSGPGGSIDKIKRTCTQAQMLLDHCGPKLAEDKRAICKAWADLPHMRRCKRIATLMQYGFNKPTRLRNFLFYICNMLYR